MLSGYYKIDKIIGEGSFGEVYKVIDTDNQSLPLIGKIQTCKTNHENEVSVLEKLPVGCSMFPKLYASGQRPDGKYIIIMDRFGATLQQRLEERGKFSYLTC